MDLKLFAERLNDLIFENKFSVGEVSKQSGVARSSIYEYLSGEKMPTLKNVLSLADYFKISTDFLLGLESENYTTEFLPIKPFAERFNEVIKHYDISRYKIEKDSHLSQSTLYYWAKGHTKKPTVEKLIEVALILGCSLDYLLGRTNTI